MRSQPRDVRSRQQQPELTPIVSAETVLVRIFLALSLVCFLTGWTLFYSITSLFWIATIAGFAGIVLAFLTWRLTKNRS